MVMALLLLMTTDATPVHPPTLYRWFSWANGLTGAS
jgi:hypothetical protein